MSTLVQVLAELERRDVRLFLEGERLQCDAPKGAVTPDLVEILRERKEELLLILAYLENHKPLHPLQDIAHPYRREFTIGGPARYRFDDPFGFNDTCLELELRDIRLAVDGPRLLAFSPPGAMSPLMLASVERWKKELRNILNYPDNPPASATERRNP